MIFVEAVQEASKYESDGVVLHDGILYTNSQMNTQVDEDFCREQINIAETQLREMALSSMAGGAQYAWKRNLTAWETILENIILKN